MTENHSEKGNQPSRSVHTQSVPKLTHWRRLTLFRFLAAKDQLRSPERKPRQPRGQPRFHHQAQMSRGSTLRLTGVQVSFGKLDGHRNRSHASANQRHASFFDPIVHRLPNCCEVRRVTATTRMSHPTATTTTNIVPFYVVSNGHR